MNLPIHQPTMTSLQIAEVAGKRHCDVMRSIRRMEDAWYKVCGRKFALTFSITDLPNGATRKDPCYNLTKEECLYIATKFNDEARAKLVLRWMELERQQNQPRQTIAEMFAESHRLADEMREDLANGKATKWTDVILSTCDIATYTYLRNSLKSVVDAPFYTSYAMISKALGIDIPYVKAAFTKLEKAGYLVTREASNGDKVFILGSRLP